MIAGDTALESRLETMLASFVDDRTLGIVMALDIPGRERLAISVGHADLERSVPLGRRALFQIGSVTKSFTAAMLVKLEKGGLLSLESPAGPYVPEMPELAEIPIRQLLNHTSGLGNPSYVIEPIRYLVDYDLSFADRVLLSRVERHRGTARKGVFSYNNFGYQVAARIAERAGGKPFATLLRDKILAPLGLDDTFVGSSDRLPRERMARGYHEALNVIGPTEITDHPALREAGEAGDLVSSADDVLDWIGALQAGDPALGLSLADLTRNVVDCASEFTPSMKRYGLGVARHEFGGARYWGHGGAMCGFMAAALVDTDTGIRLSALSNKKTTHGPVWLELQRLGLVTSILALTMARDSLA